VNAARSVADRYVELWKLFRAERENPGPFYRRLAADAVAGFERRYGSLAGKVLADVGCGPGYYTEAFRGAGAVVLPIDGFVEELHLAGDPPRGDTIRRFDDHPQLERTHVEPRYWPWAAVIARVPGVREVLMWNCVIRFERL